MMSRLAEEKGGGTPGNQVIVASVKLFRGAFRSPSGERRPRAAAPPLLLQLLLRSAPRPGFPIAAVPPAAAAATIGAIRFSVSAKFPLHGLKEALQGKPGLEKGGWGAGRQRQRGTTRRKAPRLAAYDLMLLEGQRAARKENRVFVRFPTTRLCDAGESKPMHVYSEVNPIIFNRTYSQGSADNCSLAAQAYAGLLRSKPYYAQCKCVSNCSLCVSTQK